MVMFRNALKRLSILLTLEAFRNLSKADLYQVYVDIYKKLEEKEELIKKHNQLIS